MELTKKDKKHIEKQVSKLSFRIMEEASEYMRLYKKAYYEEVINMCKECIEAIDILQEHLKNISNTPL